MDARRASAAMVTVNLPFSFRPSTSTPGRWPRPGPASGSNVPVAVTSTVWPALAAGGEEVGRGSAARRAGRRNAGGQRGRWSGSRSSLRCVAEARGPLGTASAHQFADRRRVADQVGRPAVGRVQDLARVDARAWCRRSRRSSPATGRARRPRSPCASVAPTTWPPGVPPPANSTDMALDQWSRPPSLLILRRAAELAQGDDQRACPAGRAASRSSISAAIGLVERRQPLLERR